MLKNRVFIILSGLSLSLLSACQMPPKSTSPHTTKVSQIPMKVKTRASSYIYFSPMSKEQRTIYIAIQNDAGLEDFNIMPWLADSFKEKSFTIVNNVDQANVVVRANILRVGEVRNDIAQALLDSEFGNSTPLLNMVSMPDVTTQPTPNNDALVLDIQYFQRNNLIDPTEVIPRKSMADLTDIQLLLLCNTNRWERFQTRIVSIIFNSSAPMTEKLNVLAQSAEKANTDIVRGLS